MNTFHKIYEQVKKIPEGKVATYGQIALMAGNPRWSRVVGYALHSNPEPGVIPCHRVVNRKGNKHKDSRCHSGINKIATDTAENTFYNYYRK